jgi:hypothetical protein
MGLWRLHALALAQRRKVPKLFLALMGPISLAFLFSQILKEIIVSVEKKERGEGG